MRLYIIIGIAVLLNLLLAVGIIRQMGAMASKKGKKPFLWQLYGFLSWLIGALLVAFGTSIFLGIVTDIGLVWAWPASVVGGLIGVLPVWLTLRRKPSLY